MTRKSLKKCTAPTYYQVRKVLVKHFVRSGLIDELTLDRVFDESCRVRSVIVAGAHTTQLLRNHIEHYRRPLLIRLIGNELKRLTSNVGQKQDIDTQIIKGILLSRIERKRAIA